MLHQEYESISNEIKELEEKRKYYEEELRYAQEEDDIIECKFQIMKIREALSPLYSKQSDIVHEMNRLKKEKEKFDARDKVYKKFYVTLDRNRLLTLKRYFKVDGNSRDQILKSIFNKYPNGDLDYIINAAINNINKFSEFHIDEVLDIINDDGGYLENTNISPYYNNESIFNKLSFETRDCVMYIQKNYDLIFLGVNASYPSLGFEFEFLDWKEESPDEDDEDYSEEHPLDYDIYSDNHVPEGFKFEVLYRDYVDDDTLKKFSIDQKLKEYEEEQEKERQRWLKENKERLELERKQREKERWEKIEKQKRMEQIHKELKEKREKKPEIPPCYNELTENSSTEDIANCYCKCKDFNNWEYDKNNKKIIFKFLRADGKNYTKMKKVEVKKLKKWINNYELI